MQIFADLDEAKKEAAVRAAQLSRGDVDAMQLTGKDRLIYGRALEAVRTFGIPLDAAAIEYSEARKVLKSHSLIDSARFYMRHHGQGITGKLVAEAYQEFKQSKTDANRSAVYLRDIAYRVGGFSKAFHLEVRQLAPQDVADYLAALKVESRSFNNTILLLKTFFGFCQSRNWLSKDVNLLSLVERKSGTKGEIEIFTPKELRAILEKAKSRVAISIAIQAFAGVRTAELFRLTWDDLNRRVGHIEVAAAKAKTQARRLVPISTNLAAWLKRGKKEGESNRVWPLTESEYYEQLALIAKAAGVEWRVNALRHSFISYRVAQSSLSPDSPRPLPVRRFPPESDPSRFSCIPSEPFSGCPPSLGLAQMGDPIPLLRIFVLAFSSVLLPDPWHGLSMTIIALVPEKKRQKLGSFRHTSLRRDVRQ